ncbi:hypothetical protein KKC13_06340 [bacterium]|nr:hypothetical protein [bacterium]MBU1957476.1 hypothetical protein [bacterium]
MRLKIILLIGVMLFIPMASIAEESKSESMKIESMNIQALIEKAKEASSDDRVKIEDLIKKKIAQAHRENSIKG